MDQCCRSVAVVSREEGNDSDWPNRDVARDCLLATIPRPIPRDRTRNLNPPQQRTTASNPDTLFARWTKYAAWGRIQA